MGAYASDTPILLIKKIGGIALLIFGLLLTAFGYASETNSILMLGVLLLALGLALLALKIAWRNQL